MLEISWHIPTSDILVFFFDKAERHDIVDIVDILI